MTYRSESRGLMYTSPPTGDDVDRTGETKAKTTEEQTDDATAPDSAAEATAPEPATSTTDANWTGTVPADD